MGRFSGDLWIAGAAFAASWLLSLLAGSLLLPVLRRRGVGQHIRPEGPQGHLVKEGTPTMGGIGFVSAFLLVTGAICVLRGARIGARRVLPLALTILYAAGNAAVGFADDRAKLAAGPGGDGLSPVRKLIPQAALAAGYLAALSAAGSLPTAVGVPFSGVRLELGYLAFALYLPVLTGFVNATNLTDGIDGLASSVTAAVSLCVALLALKRAGEEAFVQSSVLAAALCGCVLAFLFHNRHPARMFMGDTGSLFLGSVLMGCAVLTGELPTVLLSGAVFVVEMLSSLLQRLYFKLTRGRRLFRMAPLHHDFEKRGYGERGIVALFTAAAVLCCLLAWIGA